MHDDNSTAEGITVADALALPELRAGAPELIAGEGGLDRPVRWAHVVAGADAATLLDGGELVLTTGAGWPGGAAGLERVARELLDADPAAIVLELGRFYDEAPAPLVAECDARGVPLIALHRAVRFVQITQRVHQRILAAQTEALEARAAVHDMLTELGLNRSPVDYVVARLSETLDTAVVLEDSAGNVVAWAGAAARGAGESVGAQVLAPWAEAGGRARPRPAIADGSDGADRVPVEAQGRRWGALTALPGPAHPAGRRTVLELGAFALALGRLADPDGAQWMRLGSKQVFDALLGGRYRRDAELETQLAASGLPVRGRIVLGATLRGTGDFGAASVEHARERDLLETALRRAVAPEGRVIVAPQSAVDGAGGGSASGGSADPSSLLALLSFPLDDPRATAASAHTPSALVTRLAHEVEALLPPGTPAGWRAHLALGAAGRGLRSLIASVERVRAAGRLSPVAGTGRVTVQQAERQALAYLVRGLSATPEMQEFVEGSLAPLVEHDAAQGPGHSGDLLRVLAAYLEHPTNRSLAAQQARLSRSVFYQRLALIEDLLDVRLSDGATIAALTVALLARPSAA